MASGNSSAGGGGQATGGNLSTVDRSQRSIFVGNISYEATEEQIKAVFSTVGPVVHFRLVYDRDTGKPKGYGFCEFVDQQTADSAIRNLNGFEFHGRALRVDSAAGSDRNKEEIRQLQITIGGPQEESPYGNIVEQNKAPEAISRAVASLPPEQMFELMKQMKLCVQNNPNEARNMLLQNPQLAYALLQAQVVMRILEPQVAMTMLHRDTGPPQPPMLPPGGPPMIPQPMGVRPPMGPPLGMRPPGPMMGLPPGLLGQRMPPPPMSMAPPTQPTNFPQMAPALPVVSSASAPPKPTAGGEDEKTQLIMQVLQLTDEQINLLPPDQKQSVLILREQLRSA